MRAESGPREAPKLVFVSGLSGAGKASILRILEDIGYEAVDNPPLQMLQDLIDGALADQGRRLAIGIDVRSHGFAPQAVLSTLSSLRTRPRARPELIYVWADDDNLQRRFSQTRRRHPLAGDGGVADGIAIERTLTFPLRGAADFVIDTTDLALSDLRRMVVSRYQEPSGTNHGDLLVTLISFAFPAGLPREADMVFDVRFLKNPHYVALLGPRTGQDPAVAAFVEDDPDFHEYFERLSGLVMFTLPRFVADGKKYVSIAVGCTGGRHRSVVVAEKLRDVLQAQDWRVGMTHRELDASMPAEASASCGPS